MRTICISICLIGLLVVGGCEVVYHYDYIVENKTDHVIRIEGYDRFDFATSEGGIKMELNENDLSPVDIIDIDPHSKYSVTKGKGFHADPQGPFSVREIDSVNIIFNNQKILVLYCNDRSSLRDCELERNIMDFEREYERKKIGRSSGQNEYSFTYNITEEDYNNATQIDVE